MVEDLVRAAEIGFEAGGEVPQLLLERRSNVLDELHDVSEVGLLMELSLQLRENLRKVGHLQAAVEVV